jgi:hypothetical protein
MLAIVANLLVEAEASVLPSIAICSSMPTYPSRRCVFACSALLTSLGKHALIPPPSSSWSPTWF